MNKVFNFILLCSTSLLMALATNVSHASLIGDEICFMAIMEGQPPITIPRQPPQQPFCPPETIQLPVDPIDIEIVQLQLTSIAPIPTNAPDSFFDIFVDIDIADEYIQFDFFHQLHEPNILLPPLVPGLPELPPFPPECTPEEGCLPPWSFWFDDLNWLTPDGLPMDGWITGFWLLGFNVGGDPENPDMFPENQGISGFNISFEPHALHVDLNVRDLSGFALDGAMIESLRIELHTQHPIPEPNTIALILLALSSLLFAVRKKLKTSSI